jgi:hypothetical protein
MATVKLKMKKLRCKSYSIKNGGGKGKYGYTHSIDTDGNIGIDRL